MQRPTPQDGDFFKSDMVLPYKRADLPPRLRIYAASDHAVGTKQANDKTCLLIVGVDEYDNIWLLDCFWKRTKTDEVVDAMLNMMRKWRPKFWWAVGGHILNTIGPLRFSGRSPEKVNFTEV